MTEEQPLESAPPPPVPETERPVFWGYADLFLVAGLALPCMFLIAPGIVRLVFWILRVRAAGEAARGVPAMVLGYILIFSAVMVIFRVQYDRPFWRSLGWVRPQVPLVWCLLWGFGTSLLVALVGWLIHTPPPTGPLVEMMHDRRTLVLLAIFGTTAAPLFEELTFRGFLQPLLARSLGAAAGIGLAAALFGALHFSEYGNSWRSVLQVSISGVSFGCLRHFTGSTRASAVAHAAFNALPFISLFTQGKA